MDLLRTQRWNIDGQRDRERWLGEEGVVSGEVLVVSSTGSLLVSLAIEMSLLGVVLLIAGNMILPWLVPLVLILALLAIFAVGIGLALAALNVYYRDIAYLWTIVVQAWFYLTPVVWTLDTVPTWLARLASWQPMGAFVIAIRDVLYELRWPAALRWTQLIIYAVVALGLGQLIFARMSPRFAEEL